MQIHWNQTNPFSHFNSQFANSVSKSNMDSLTHSKRRMLEAQSEARKTEAARVTISGEAMALAKQAKALERLGQYRDNTNAQESEDFVQLTDEDVYEELLNQVGIWGDKSHALLHDFNHEETAEMAEKKAAALNEIQKLEQMQKSEINRLQKDAQKAAEQASLQQEEINQKNSELIMMLESFESQDEDKENDKAAEDEDKKEENANVTGSLMEGKNKAMAVKGEMGILDNMNGMDSSSTFRIGASDHSIKAVETERKNIYRANSAENFTMKEKIDEMYYYVSVLANQEDMKNSFMERIENETNPYAKKKLYAMMEYFSQMDMKDEYHNLKEDREFALQERITARDLRIAHLGSQHFVLAEQQNKELQSLFGEDDILRAQGQDGIASRTEELAQRVQEKLDDRDHVDGDRIDKDNIEKELRAKEEQEQKEDETERQE